MTTYVSVDVEATGPIPGLYSMISLGAAAYDEQGKELASFYANLNELPGAQRDADTMLFWQREPEAWNRATSAPSSPDFVMKVFDKWLEDLPGQKVFLAYPAGFDFTFIYWYLIVFAGRSVPGFSVLDLKTYAYAYMGRSFKNVSKSKMPKHWMDVDHKHTHHALEDAREQARIFFRAKADMDKMRSTYEAMEKYVKERTS